MRVALAIVVCVALIALGASSSEPVLVVAGVILLGLVVLRGIVIGLVRDVRHGR